MWTMASLRIIAGTEVDRKTLHYNKIFNEMAVAALRMLVSEE